MACWSWFFRAFFTLSFALTGCAQTATEHHPPENIHVKNPTFDRKLSAMLRYDVPLISVDSLFHHRDAFHLLDTRTTEEFQTSHIKGAFSLHADQPEWQSIKQIPREQPIVVYCSIGYRSEKIGKKLLEMGFTSVYNLYGSIFEWVNRGYDVVDSRGAKTRMVHTYNRRWSRYINHPDIQKTW